MFCTFVLQICFNSWQGSVIKFSDFSGDIEKLTVTDMINAIRTVYIENIASIMWYVPGNIIGGFLEYLGAVNITEKENWNVASLIVRK